MLVGPLVAESDGSEMKDKTNSMPLTDLPDSFADAKTGIGEEQKYCRGSAPGNRFVTNRPDGRTNRHAPLDNAESVSFRAPRYRRSSFHRSRLDLNFAFTSGHSDSMMLKEAESR